MPRTPPYSLEFPVGCIATKGLDEKHFVWLRTLLLCCAAEVVGTSAHQTEKRGRDAASRRANSQRACARRSQAGRHRTRAARYRRGDGTKRAASATTCAATAGGRPRSRRDGDRLSDAPYRPGRAQARYRPRTQRARRDDGRRTTDDASETRLTPTPTSALAEAGLDARRASLVVRRGKGRRRRVAMDDPAWEQLQPWLTARAEPASRPAALHRHRADRRARNGRPRPRARSYVTLPRASACAGGSHRTTSATRRPSRWPGRACRRRPSPSAPRRVAAGGVVLESPPLDDWLAGRLEAHDVPLAGGCVSGSKSRCSTKRPADGDLAASA
jgi:hypothetical protein